MKLLRSEPASTGVCRSSSTALAKTVSRRISLDQQDTELETMSAICPLNDEHLPLDASNIKNMQVSATQRSP